MRTIKFRAWDKDRQYMSTDDYWLKGVMGNNNCTTSECRGLIIMQFTGLLDKNGKEIYEGDILSHFDKTYMVKWDERMAAFQSENPKDSVDADFFNWGNVPSLETNGVFGKQGNCEVIGNIYQNPELLNN